MRKDRVAVDQIKHVIGEPSGWPPVHELEAAPFVRARAKLDHLFHGVDTHEPRRLDVFQKESYDPTPPAPKVQNGAALGKRSHMSFILFLEQHISTKPLAKDLFVL